MKRPEDAEVAIPRIISHYNVKPRAKTGKQADSGRVAKQNAGGGRRYIPAGMLRSVVAGHPEDVNAIPSNFANSASPTHFAK